MLVFQNKMLKKPAPTWGDDSFRLACSGERLDLINDSTGKHMRFYERIGSPGITQVAPKVEPMPTSKKDPPAPVAPAASTAHMAGIWIGELPGPDKTIVLRIFTDRPKKKDDVYHIEGNLTVGDRFAGRFAAGNGKPVAESPGHQQFAPSSGKWPGVPEFPMPKFSIGRVKEGLELTFGAQKTILKAGDESDYRKLPQPPLVSAKETPKVTPTGPDAGRQAWRIQPRSQEGPAGPDRRPEHSEGAAQASEDSPGRRSKPRSLRTFHDHLDVSVPGRRLRDRQGLVRCRLRHGFPDETLESKRFPGWNSVSVAMSRDGKSIFAGESGGEALNWERFLRTYDAQTGKLSAAMKSQVQVDEMHPTKPLIYVHVRGQDLVGGLMDLKTGKFQWKLDKHAPARFDPTGTYLLAKEHSFREKDVLRLIDAETGKTVHEFGVENVNCGAGAFSPDGKRLATYCRTTRSEFINILDV